jgi:hypothetical protein
MAAIRSLQPAIGSLVRNPIIVIVAAMYSLLQLPQLLVPTTQPLLSIVVSLVMTGMLILFLPFYQGGIIGMADDARTGTTTLGMLIETGKSNYVSLLLAYFVILAIAIVLGIVVAIAAIGGGIGVIAGNGQPSPAVLAVLAIVGLLIAVAYFAVVIAIQFYAHEIVLNNAGVAEGFTRSVGLVRENVLSVLGYSLLMFVGGGIIGALGAGASFLVSPQPPLESMLPELSLPVIVGAAIVSVLASALLGAFYATYSVTFYRNISGPSQAGL